LKKGIKYDTSGLEEGQFEPGSGNRVLKNLLKIRRKRDMDQREAQEQLRALDAIARWFRENHKFTADDICHIHKVWLGGIYPWAGQYRQVNVSKGSFSFAAAGHIPSLMQEFERTVLFKFTPCRANSITEIIKSLAVVHTELVLIHPFREGNGRTARLLSILMGLQAQLPTLDFGGIVGKKKEEYFAAVRAGMARNYKPMEAVFESVVKRSLKNSSKR
jgi:cell filamentation protein